MLSMQFLNSKLGASCTPVGRRARVSRHLRGNKQTRRNRQRRTALSGDQIIGPLITRFTPRAPLAQHVILAIPS